MTKNKTAAQKPTRKKTSAKIQKPKTQKSRAFDLAKINASESPLETLQQLLRNSDDARVQLAAAKALLDYLPPHDQTDQQEQNEWLAEIESLMATIADRLSAGIESAAGVAVHSPSDTTHP